MAEVEERIESLETLLGRFILHTDMSLNRLTREVDRLSKEVDKLTKEMQAFREQAEKDRHAMQEWMQRFEEQAERDRQALHERMQRFEEQAERDRQALHERMQKFEERAEKDRQALHEEISRFKEKVGKFIEKMNRDREEAKQERIEMNRRWGEIANKMGTLVEDMVAPNIRGIARKYFGCEEFEDFMVRRIRRHSTDRAKRREFDVIAVFERSVIVNETKSTPRINYIDDFIKVLSEFYDYFPEYSGKRLIPIFASLYLEEDVIESLTKNKIYAMALKEDTMDLLNFEDIQVAH